MTVAKKNEVKELLWEAEKRLILGENPAWLGNIYEW